MRFKELDSVKKREMQKGIFNYFFLVVGFFFLFLLEKNFFPNIFVFDIVIDLIFIAVFLLNLLKSQKIGLWAGFFGGFLLDFVSAFPWGTFSLTLVIMALLIQKLEIWFHKSNLFSFIAVFIFSFLFYKLFALAIASIIDLFFNKELHFSLFFNSTDLVRVFLCDFFLAGLFFTFFSLIRMRKGSSF